jgi:hypothetical protein
MHQTCCPLLLVLLVLVLLVLLVQPRAEQRLLL